MLVIEIAINGSFLAESNLGGILGGFVQAAGFAGLNIIGSFMWGLGPRRVASRTSSAWSCGPKTLNVSLEN
jgi:hypothetical protein